MPYSDVQTEAMKHIASIANTAAKSGSPTPTQSTLTAGDAAAPAGRPAGYIDPKEWLAKNKGGAALAPAGGMPPTPPAAPMPAPATPAAAAQAPKPVQGPNPAIKRRLGAM